MNIFRTRSYYFTTGLLYPGALGAALSWLVEAASAAVRGQGQSTPTLWALAFVVWLTAYHTLWYIRLLADFAPDSSGNAGDYKGSILATDVLESLVLLLALGSLDFRFGEPGPIARVLTFVAPATIALGAAIHGNRSFSGERTRFTWVVVAVAAIGILINGAAGENPVTAIINWIALGVLYVLLSVYVFRYYGRSA